MFSRYIDTEDFLPLTMTGNYYLIDVKGKVIDVNGNVVKTFLDDEDDISIKIHWINGLKNYKLHSLIAATFKPLHVPPQLWKFIKLLG